MNNGTILIVEDNPDDRVLAIRALKKAHLLNEIVTAQDGAQALELLYGPEGFAERGRLPALVLLDLKLPKVSGLEVLRRIREDPRTRHMPTVILTSSDEERDRLQGYERGANSFVRKPMMFADFIEAVGQLGLYWTVLNRLPPDGPS